MSKSKHYLAFNNRFFATHQRSLLWVLNTPHLRRLSRWLLQIDRSRCEVGSAKIEQITPNAICWRTGRLAGRIQMKAEFRSADLFGKRLYYALLPLWWAMHFWDWIFADRVAPQLSFGFSTLTKYPDADPETTSVDGRVSYATGAGGSWATAHDALTGTAVDDSGTSILSGSSEQSGVSNNYSIFRAFLLFDTSALTAGATISAAVLSIWVFSLNNGDNDGQDYVNVFDTTPASNTSISTADYDQIGTTKLSTDKDFGTITGDDTVYTDFTLNATGIAAISKTGITKLGIREGHDVENASIASNVGNSITFHSAENASGTAKAPKLVITYTVVSNYTSTLTDSVSAGDSVLKQPARLLTQTVSLSDVLTAMRILVKTLSDSVTNTGSIVRSFVRTLTDSVSAADTVPRSLQRLYSDSLSLTAAVLKVGGKILTESVTTTTAFLRAITKILSENVTSADTNPKFLQRLYTEATTLLSSLEKLPGKVVTQAIAFTDSLLRSPTRTLTESLTPLSVLSRLTTRTHNDSLTLSDSLLRIFTKLLSESLSILDSILKRLNGLRTLYSSKFTARGSSHGSKFSTRNTSHSTKFE